MSDLITAKTMAEALEKGGVAEIPELATSSTSSEEMAIEFRRFLPLDEYLEPQGLEEYLGLISARVVQGTLAFEGDEAFATSLYLNNEEVKLYTVRALGVTMPKSTLREVYADTKKRMKKIAHEAGSKEEKHAILNSASAFETMTAVSSCYRRTFLFGFPTTIENQNEEEESVWAGAFVLYDMKEKLNAEDVAAMDTYDFAEKIKNLFTFYPTAPHDFYASVALETAAQYIQQNQAPGETTHDPNEE